MRTQGDIRQKIKQAQFRHVKRILKSTLPKGEEWTREEVESIKDQYKEFFSSSPIHVIAKDFPDVAALMWVLDDHPECCLIPDGSIVGSLGGVILWADSESEAESARSTMESIINSAVQKTKSEDVTPHPQPVRDEGFPPPDPLEVIVEAEEPVTSTLELQSNEPPIRESNVRGFNWLEKIWRRIFF
jgi:hypothetical protein